MLIKALQEVLRRLPLIGHGLTLVWQATPRWTLAWGVLLLIQGLVPGALVVVTRHAVNTLAGALSSAHLQADFASAWPSLALIALLLVLGQFLTSLISWVRSVQSELVQDHIKALIHAQAARLDLAFFDDAASYDLLYRASVEALQRPAILLENLGNLIQSCLTLLALTVLLAAYTPWLPFLLVASALPGLWTVGRFIMREHQWRVKNTINDRYASYYDWMQTEQDSAAEIRVFELGEYHRRSFQEVRRKLHRGRFALAKAELRAELAAGTLAWGGAFAGIGWMLVRASRGLAKLGDLVLCYQAFQQGQTLLRSLLENTGQIYRSTLFLENLVLFLSLEPQVTDPPAPLQVPSPLKHGITLENVTFHYPGSERAALQNFSLALQAGKTTAIVGHNGAGKSTLTKLLCRFYDPQQGRILMDGVDLRQLRLAELRRQITVLFQEPVHYHETAAQNIAMGDLAAERAALETAARAGGAASFLEKLPQGYDTVLGKWFGGSELSVGEWQRVAMARAFLRDAPIIILDEPTSAMDSWAEHDWLSRFSELTRGHTALMITHRFTTAMHADVIHVMEEGRVTESGTHAELVAAGGHYAQSWRAQLREVQHG